MSASSSYWYRLTTSLAWLNPWSLRKPASVRTVERQDGVLVVLLLGEIEDGFAVVGHDAVSVEHDQALVGVRQRLVVGDEHVTRLLVGDQEGERIAVTHDVDTEEPRVVAGRQRLGLEAIDRLFLRDQVSRSGVRERDVDVVDDRDHGEDRQDDDHRHEVLAGETFSAPVDDVDESSPGDGDRERQPRLQLDHSDDAPESQPVECDQEQVAHDGTAAQRRRTPRGPGSCRSRALLGCGGGVPGCHRQLVRARRGSDRRRR